MVWFGVYVMGGVDHSLPPLITILIQPPKKVSENTRNLTDK